MKVYCGRQKHCAFTASIAGNTTSITTNTGSIGTNSGAVATLQGEQTTQNASIAALWLGRLKPS